MRNFIVLNSLIWLFTISAYSQISPDLLRKAENGSITSQMELAKCYYEGDGVDQDWVEALKWYEKAANKNNVEAMVACGEILCDEWNLYSNPDYVKGIYWYRKAAANGNQKAKEFLSNKKFEKEEISHECPFTWLPCDEDLGNYDYLKENELLIRTKYNSKDPIAAYYLAIISYIDKDYEKTVKYLTEIYPLVINEADFGEDFLDREKSDNFGEILGARVFSLLGWCYEFGQGVNRDFVKAAEYYMTDFDYSAYTMSTIPRVRGAYCYKKAGLIEKFIKEVDSQHFGLVNTSSFHSSEFKVLCLQLELAEMYKTGDGVIQDKKKALAIYESIVDKRKDLVSLYWPLPEFRSFSDVGRAAYRASLMYKNGEGCEADQEMAKLYFDIALKYGDNNAWYENEHK